MMPASSGIEILSLRRVAARCIAKNEQDGLDTLDAITAALFGQIRWRYRLWMSAVFVATIVFGSAITVSVVIAIDEPTHGNLMVASVLILLFLYYCVLSSWRWYQYGLGFERKIQSAIYAAADAATTKNLDRLFSVMQLETTRQAFWRTRSGNRHEVSRQQFFGCLRLLMLSEHDWVRERLFSPRGMWFSRELLIEDDVAALIAQTQAKPKAGGRPKVYDEAAILLAIIENPALAAIATGKHGAETHVMNIIRDACQADRDGASDIAVPEDTVLRALAKQILTAIEKNRACQK